VPPGNPGQPCGTGNSCNSGTRGYPASLCSPATGLCGAGVGADCSSDDQCFAGVCSGSFCGGCNATTARCDAGSYCDDVAPNFSACIPY
jgi:hypothetical protein